MWSANSSSPATKRSRTRSGGFKDGARGASKAPCWGRGGAHRGPVVLQLPLERRRAQPGEVPVEQAAGVLLDLLVVIGRGDAQRLDHLGALPLLQFGEHLPEPRAALAARRDRQLAHG